MTLELSNAEILMIQEALWSAQADARLDLADLWAKLPVWTAEEAPLLKRLLDLDALLTKTFPAPSPPAPFDPLGGHYPDFRSSLTNEEREAVEGL